MLEASRRCEQNLTEKKIAKQAPFINFEVAKFVVYKINQSSNWIMSNSSMDVYYVINI